MTAPTHDTVPLTAAELQAIANLERSFSARHRCLGLLKRNAGTLLVILGAAMLCSFTLNAVMASAGYPLVALGLLSWSHNPRWLARAGRVRHRWQRIVAWSEEGVPTPTDEA